MDFVKKHIDWLPVILIVIILGGSFPFKFADAPITVHIFDVVGQFLGLDFFRTYGGYIIGAAELVAVVAVLIPATRAIGGLMASGIMTGAIIFHLFSPLGVTVHWEENGVAMEDGTLFYTAIVVFISGLYLANKGKDQILGLIGMGGNNE